MANSKAAGSGQEASRRKRAVSAADRTAETAGKSRSSRQSVRHAKVLRQIRCQDLSQKVIKTR